MKTTTTEQKHTPGPWKTAGNAVYTHGKTYVAQCFSEPDRDLSECGMDKLLGNERVPSNDREAEANARLIAAAPDMVAALEEILEWTRGDKSAAEKGDMTTTVDAETLQARVQTIRSALTRATGGQP